MRPLDGEQFAEYSNVLPVLASEVQVQLIENLLYSLERLTGLLNTHPFFRNDFDLQESLEHLLGAKIDVPDILVCNTIVSSLHSESLSSLGGLRNIELLIGMLKIIREPLLRNANSSLVCPELLWTKLSLAAATDLEATFARE